MVKYKIIQCPRCKNFFITTSSKNVTCRYCGKWISIKKAYREGYIMYTSDSWIEIQIRLQKLEKYLEIIRHKGESI